MSDQEIKAGAAISRQNRTKMQSMHDMLVEMGAACDTPGHDYTPIGKSLEELRSDLETVQNAIKAAEADPSAKAGFLDTDASSITPYASMKAIGDRLLEVKVAYYGHKNGKDGHGEYFSPNTDFDPDNFPQPPLLYYHGFDAQGKKMGKPAVTGKFQSRRVGADGHYLTYKLKNTKYADLQWDSAQKSVCVVSPGTIGHLIRKQPDGELTYWPLAEISAWDYAANRAPANLHSVAAPVIKALYSAEGLTLSPLIDTVASESPEALGDSASEQAQAGGADISPDEQARIIATEVAAVLLAKNMRTL
jgi:hypothetical protein